MTIIRFIKQARPSGTLSNSFTSNVQFHTLHQQLAADTLSFGGVNKINIALLEKSIPLFHVVDPQRAITRGVFNKNEETIEAALNAGIRHFVDLRGNNEIEAYSHGKDTILQVAQRLGINHQDIKYSHFPINIWSCDEKLVSQEVHNSLEPARQAINKAGLPAIICCKQGIERTGVFSAYIKAKNMGESFDTVVNDMINVNGGQKTAWIDVFIGVLKNKLK